MRKYKRQAGTRRYASSYSADDVRKALQKISGGMSILKASSKYRIPYGTLYNKVHHLHTKAVGTPHRLSPITEQLIVNAVNTLAQWKVPVDGFDIRCLVKSYLDKQGVRDRRFANNLPGIDWLHSFMQRHQLTARIADNVKPARAEITVELVNQYFDELEATLQGIDPSCLFNYDETNVADDPGAKKVICRRGLKRVERKIEHTKSCVSLMFCGSATGQYLPPMVVYKSQNVYQEWTRGGPNGAVYDCTTSGWFDGRCFERWFNDIFLPAVSSKPGRKVLIGDNLSAHFTPDVIQSSVQNNIAFVTLIPNATHLLQPLDVAVFRSVKIKWRAILDGWRKESRYRGVLPKNHFPGLLQKLHNSLKADNIVAGFKATGLCPLNRDEVLKRLPDVNRDGATGAQPTTGSSTGTGTCFNDSIMEILEKHCAPSTSAGKRSRGKKVTPGKAITPSDLADTPTTSQSGTRSAASTSTGTKSGAVQYEDDTDDTEVEPDTDDTDSSSSDKDAESSEDASTGNEQADVKSSQWVIVKYAGKRSVSYFLGQVLEVIAEGVRITFVKRQAGSDQLFKFPVKEDIDIVQRDDIVDTLDQQPPMNNRQQFVVKYTKFNLS